MNGFDIQKIVQCLNFLARNKRDQRISKLDALKLIYLADRYHLRKYARTITGDSYFAMQYGPVASMTKDVAECNKRRVPSNDRAYVQQHLKLLDTRTIESQHEVDYSVFSTTDLEALRAAENLAGQYGDLIALTHKFPEWLKHEKTLRQQKSVPMSLLDFFEKAPADVEYAAADAKLLRLNRSFFKDRLELFA